MPLAEIISHKHYVFNPLKNRPLVYLFCCIFFAGYIFDISLIGSLNPVYYVDLFSAIISIILIVLFFFKRIYINHVVQFQILVMLTNMILSHYINPIHVPEFPAIFLRNMIIMFMLIPIYGLYCGKYHISHIAIAYLWLYASLIIRVHDHFLVNNAPMLMSSSILYIFGVFYIFDTLESLHRNQLELSENLEEQKDQLVLKNIDLEIKNHQIHEQSHELTQLLATKDKLFSIVGHDLRNPFNTVLGFVALLKRNIDVYDKEKIIEFIGHIESSIDGSLNLLNNLLIWANTQTGNILFKPEKYNFRLILSDICPILNSAAHIKDIELTCWVDENLEVFADANMLNTILRNLVSNAIKYTEHGGRIDIYSETIDGFTQIRVCDNGIGMQETDVANILQTGELVSSPGTDGEKGTGLGLILCKDFIEKHGGRLSIESKLGEGSTFMFTLPQPKT